jgi:arsenate reductase
LFFQLFRPKPPHRRNRVLFVDADGASLTAMVRAFAGRYAPQVVTEGAGVHPGPLRPEVGKVLAESGLQGPIGTKAVAEHLGAGFDTVVTLGAAAASLCPDFGPGVDRLHWGVDDPVETGGSEEEVLAAYRKCRDGLEKRVKVFFGQRKS